jgi:hypothetical protein
MRSFAPAERSLAPEVSVAPQPALQVCDALSRSRTATERATFDGTFEEQSVATEVALLGTELACRAIRKLDSDHTHRPSPQQFRSKLASPRAVTTPDRAMQSVTFATSLLRAARAGVTQGSPRRIEVTVLRTEEFYRRLCTLEDLAWVLGPVCLPVADVTRSVFPSSLCPEHEDEWLKRGG